MDFSGAGGFINPTLAGHPGTEVSFWLTDNGPLQVTLRRKSVAFIPADQVPRASIFCRVDRLRLTPLALKDFHRQPV